MNKRYTQKAFSLRNEKSSGPSAGIEVRPTICSICNPGSHCGADAYIRNGRIIKVKGSMKTHNAGTLCVKGAAGRQYVYHPDRLTRPPLSEPERGASAASSRFPGKRLSISFPSASMQSRPKPALSP